MTKSTSTSMPPSRAASTLASLALTLIPLLATSCSSNSAIQEGGPLATSGVSTTCLPLSEDGIATFGLEVLANTGAVAVILSAVSADEASELRVQEASIVPIVDQTLVGTQLTFPPVLEPSRWEQRIPAIGAVIQPGESVNLVVGVQRLSGEAGTTDGLDVSYSVGNDSFIRRSENRLELRESCTE